MNNFENSFNDCSFDNEKIILEGITSISACIKNYDLGSPVRNIYEIWIDSEHKHETKFGKRISFLKAKAAEHGFSVKMCPSAEIDSAASGKTHGGIIAFVGKRKLRQISSDIISKNGFYMMFDGIEDPYSFGYSLRSLYASGADGVIIPSSHQIFADAVIARSSAGASELIPIFTASDGLCQTVNLFKENGYRALCSGIRNSMSYIEADLKRPLLIVMGGEKRGISASLIEACDGTVRIDYGRDFIGSLSTASAVSVLSFEVLRNSKDK